MQISSNNIKGVYRYHHDKKSRENFAFFEKDRGELFARLIGIGKKVLDLGCRDGTLTKYYSRGNYILGVDIDTHLLEKCRQSLGIKTLEFNLNKEDWPWKKNYFDVVVAGEVLEHLYYPELVIRNVLKTLKPGGILLGSVPNSFHIFDRLGFLFGRSPRGFADETHVNLFSYGKIASLLGEYFFLVKITPLTGKKFYYLSLIWPSFFADDIVFWAKNKRFDDKSANYHT